MSFLRIMVSDLKMIMRDPIMALLFFVPLMIGIIFKLMIHFLLPLALEYVEFSLPLEPYLLSMTLLMTPYMLGVVMGFMMLDDKDGNIIDLVLVTPYGRRGYLLNRIIFISIFTFLYSMVNDVILNLVDLNIFSLLYISILLSVFAASIGLLFFRIASDKIIGLTYAKILNFVIIFVFADFIKAEWFLYVAGLFPTFWITRLITDPGVVENYIISGIVVLVWFLILYKSGMGYKKRSSYGHN
ncbi:MAG: hypothetical protein K8R73_01860 [Clostridiales bacterium]|nr:hypothetical protein [Clostridiales bacterium]